MESLLLLEVTQEVLGSLPTDLQGPPQIFSVLERTTLKSGITCWLLKDSSQLGKRLVTGEKPPSGSFHGNRLQQMGRERLWDLGLKPRASTSLSLASRKVKRQEQHT